MARLPWLDLINAVDPYVRPYRPGYGVWVSYDAFLPEEEGDLKDYSPGELFDLVCEYAELAIDCESLYVTSHPERRLVHFSMSLAQLAGESEGWPEFYPCNPNDIKT